MRPSPRAWIDLPFNVTIGAVLLSLSLSSAARDLRFSLVPRIDVETRLGEYAGTNKERGDTLKRMFADAGCSEHLAEQKMRSRPPNVICVLPGSSDRVIIVG